MNTHISSYFRAVNVVRHDVPDALLKNDFSTPPLDPDDSFDWPSLIMGIVFDVMLPPNGVLAEVALYKLLELPPPPPVREGMGGGTFIFRLGKDGGSGPANRGEEGV